MITGTSYTNSQGDIFPEAVMVVVPTLRNNDRLQLDYVDGEYVTIDENSSSNIYVSYTARVWSKLDNHDSGFDHYNYEQPTSKLTNFDFRLEGEYLEYYNNFSGTEEEKLVSVCEKHFEEVILTLQNLNPQQP